MIYFANRLVSYRKRKGWSQSELADRSGIHRSRIGHYETSMTLPSVDNLVNLAKALGVSTDDLLGLSPPPEADPLRPEDRVLVSELERRLRGGR